MKKLPPPQDLTLHKNQGSTFSRKESFGFTLIELMVVSFIIGILTLITYSSFTNLQRNGRDARRKSDLSVVKSALEQYHADQNYYPASIDFTTPGAISFGTHTYLAKVPKETYHTTQYIYVPTTFSGGSCDNAGPVTYCTTYKLCAKLESPAATDTCSVSGNHNFEVAAP